MTRTALALAAGALLVTTTACGSGEESPTGSSSATPRESPGTTEGCDGETQEVSAARGVTLSVPADWKVEPNAEGTDVRLAGPDGDTVEGQVVVQPGDVEEGLTIVEQLNSQGEETSADQIELPGFDDARELRYSSTTGPSSYVVGSAGDDLVVAYVIVDEGAAAQQALAFGCLRTLRRQG